MTQEELKNKIQQEFEKACNALEITPSVPNVEGIPTEYQFQVIYAYMMIVIEDYQEIKDKK